MSSKSEGELQDNTRLFLGKIPGLAAWRNNVGVAKHFDERTHRLQLVKYGLANGSADLIVCFRGRFGSLELKSESGRASKEQQQWARTVTLNGGVAGFARTLGDVQAFVERMKNDSPAQRYVDAMKRAFAKHGLIGADGGTIPVSVVLEALEDAESAMERVIPFGGSHG